MCHCSLSSNFAKVNSVIQVNRLINNAISLLFLKDFLAGMFNIRKLLLATFLKIKTLA